MGQAGVAGQRDGEGVEMFRNAQGKFDGRIFIGVMMGLGSVCGVLIPLWRSIGDSVPPFWLWAIPVVFLLVGISAWIQRWHDQRAIRERLERSAHLDRTRPREREESAG